MLYLSVFLSLNSLYEGAGMQRSWSIPQHKAVLAVSNQACVCAQTPCTGKAEATQQTCYIMTELHEICRSGFHRERKRGEERGGERKRDAK